ncbi:MAG: RNA polymerase sigma factor [Pirellulales bacterium]
MLTTQPISVTPHTVATPLAPATSTSVLAGADAGALPGSAPGALAETESLERPPRDQQEFEAGDQPLTPRHLTALVHAYHAPLYRYAFRLAGNAQDAEDLVQQTFLAAHRRGSSVRDPERVGSWLYAVLRNAYLKSCRRLQPVAASTVEMDLDGLPGVAAPDRWEGRDLQEALDALSPEFKIVVLMFYFEDASYKEIADQLQIPIGTVMSRLSRAKALLRGLLLDQPAAKHLPAKPLPANAPPNAPSLAPLLRPTCDRP